MQNIVTSVFFFFLHPQVYIESVVHNAYRIYIKFDWQQYLRQ